MLQQAESTLLLSENNHIQWQATTYMLNYNYTDQDKASTSFAQHRQHAFKYKLFTEELSTLARLNQKRSDLYDKMTYILYDQKMEI